MPDPWIEEFFEPGKVEDAGPWATPDYLRTDQSDRDRAFQDEMRRG